MPDANPRRAAVAQRARVPVVTSGPVRLGRIGAQSGHGIAGSSDVALVDGGADRRRANTAAAKLAAGADNAATSAVVGVAGFIYANVVTGGGSSRTSTDAIGARLPAGAGVAAGAAVIGIALLVDAGAVATGEAATAAQQAERNDRGAGAKVDIAVGDHGRDETSAHGSKLIPATSGLARIIKLGQAGSIEGIKSLSILIERPYDAVAGTVGGDSGH